jgi:toxin ParE1/3/4
MAVKALELHPAALAELISAIDWYRQRNKSAAVSFTLELDRAIDLVTASPMRWPRGEHQTRKFVMRRFPFAIVYREKEFVIQVLAIAHGHRRPGYWKARL